MKNKYPEDFPEDFGNTPSSDKDMALINFLQQNKPSVPPPAPNFEQQLFAEISKYPQKSQDKNLNRWWPWALAIPAAIATILTINLSNNRLSTNFAVSEADQAAIEQTLISSWNTSEDLSQNTGTTISTDTQMLMDLSPLEYE